MIPAAPPSPAVGPAPAGVSAPRRTAPTGWPAVLFAAAFGVSLASFTARNGDLWRHLAAGREVARGAVSAASPTWLYDLGSYLAYAVAGGAGLVGVKALAVGGLSVLLLLSCRTGRGWAVPTACTALAVLATGTRLLAQPATASLVLLGVTVWLLRRPGPAGWWPGWRLAVLFVVWANVDRWFLFGLGTVALTWLGEALDGRGGGRRRPGAFAVLAALCLLNPDHVRAFAALAEVGPAVRQVFAAADPAAPPVPASPFGWTYLNAFWANPAGLAYYPLLGFGLLSFLFARPGHRWGRFLPWAGLAAASAVQAQTVPLFAVVGGVVLAGNLQDLFGRAGGRPSRGGRLLLGGSVTLFAVAFLVAAWPGWLRRPPYEPRRWAVEEPTALRDAAEAVRRGTADGLWPAGSKTLHLAPDGSASETADAFAWYAPDDPRLVDDDLGRALLAAGDPDERLRAAGVGRVVVSVADRGLPERVMARLLADPDGWPLVSLAGGVGVFGRRDPAAAADPYRGQTVDLNRLGFRPTAAEQAPPDRPAERGWWDAFRTPAPPVRSADREQAKALLLAAEAAVPEYAFEKVRGWQATQAGGLVGAAGGWAGVGGAADAGFRLAVLQPPVPEGVDVDPTAGLLGLQQPFAMGRDDAPPAALYAAVRAARRAAAADPSDAAAYYTLGKAYQSLLRLTRERVWVSRLPQLGRLREVQAVTAFSRAAALNPKLAAAHQELVGLYQQLGCNDLAADHLRAARDLTAESGRADREAVARLTRQADAAAAEVAREVKAFEAAAARTGVAQRAEIAAERGLGGRALAILLESDVAAFGAAGMDLELDLLLRTGRAADALAWAGPDLLEVDAVKYHWTRAQAFLAVGDYRGADAELVELTGGSPSPEQVGRVVGESVRRRLEGEWVGAPGLLPAVRRVRADDDFRLEVSQLSEGLFHQANGATLRGLIALEAGDIPTARAAFRDALAFSPGRTGGLSFPGRSVAREALDLIDPDGP